MKNNLINIEKMKLRESGDKIHQTDRNTVKQELLSGLKEQLSNTDFNGFEINKTVDGLTLSIPNSELGTIFATVDIKVRGLDYDILAEIENFNIKQKEQQEKAEKKKKEKDERKKQA